MASAIFSAATLMTREAARSERLGSVVSAPMLLAFLSWDMGNPQPGSASQNRRTTQKGSPTFLWFLDAEV